MSLRVKNIKARLCTDSLGHTGNRLEGLACTQDADSLQFNVSPTPANKSPLDSLIAIKGDARSKMTAAEFFDSITSIEKSKVGEVEPRKRRIIPYCDNSLSSGTSAFTSQDVSFDSKDSSPSDNDPSRQGHTVPSSTALLYTPAVTLAIHPITSPRQTVPAPAPVHPLSRRYHPAPLSTHQTTPTPTSQLRIEDYMASVDEPQPHTELDRTQQGNANEVRRSSERDMSEVLSNQTKDIPASLHQPPQPVSRPRDSNMSMAKAATEKLKWKFLGW